MVQFRFLNNHINYKIQFGIINMSLKGHHIGIYIKPYSFEHDLTWFLAHCFAFQPNFF
jgi:hypothetical protein